RAGLFRCLDAWRVSRHTRADASGGAAHGRARPRHLSALDGPRAPALRVHGHDLLREDGRGDLALAERPRDGRRALGPLGLGARALALALRDDAGGRGDVVEGGAHPRPGWRTPGREARAALPGRGEPGVDTAPRIPPSPRA